MSVIKVNRAYEAAVLAAVLIVSLLLVCVPVGIAHAEGGILQAGEVAGEALSADNPESPETPSPEPVLDGWVESDDGWQYWREGEMATGLWLENVEGPAIDGAEPGVHTYWVDAHGTLAMNRVVDPATKRDAGAKRCVYATEYGSFATGKHVVGNLVYLAKANGALETGDARGILTTKKYDGGTMRRYIIDKKAHAAVTGKVITVKGWGKAYAYPKKGFIVQGVKKFDETHLLLADADGKLLQRAKKGWVSTSKYAGTAQRYYLEPTTRDRGVYGARIGLFKVAGFGKAYAYPKKGYIVRGVTKFDSKHTLLADSHGKLCQKKGWLVTANYVGELQRYWLEPTAKDSSVVGARTGFFKVKNYGSLYAYPSLGYVVRGVKRFDSSHVIIADNDGKLCQKKGWVVTAKYAGELQRYWFEPTAKDKAVVGARTGSFKVEGKRYFGLSSGYVQRNTYKLEGSTIYYINNDGVMTRHDVTTNMYRKAQGYSSPSKYLLMVDIDNPKMIVFEGSRYNWNVKYIWDCCTGAPETPTVVGTFSVGIKGSSFGEDRGFSCYNYTQIYGDYLFHTRLYYANTRRLMGEDNLGNRHSHGCVHLLDENAEWIWYNVPSGTTIACIR